LLPSKLVVPPRLGFIPLFIICNVLPEGRSLTAVVLESDTAYITIMAAFSLTNGYLGSLCMINAPQVRGSFQ
jgi:equilibrative nucleoside transporter 1/2/3